MVSRLGRGPCVSTYGQIALAGVAQAATTQGSNVVLQYQARTEHCQQTGGFLKLRENRNLLQDMLPGQVCRPCLPRAKPSDPSNESITQVNTAAVLYQEEENVGRPWYGIRSERSKNIRNKSSIQRAPPCPIPPSLSNTVSLLSISEESMFFVSWGYRKYMTRNMLEPSSLGCNTHLGTDPCSRTISPTPLPSLPHT